MTTKLIRIGLLIWVLAGIGKTNAQVNIDYLLKQKQTMVKEYHALNGEEKVFLKMDFGSATIKNPKEIEEVGFAAVTKIDLVYTAFQVSDTFSQPKLNKQRLNELKKIFPQAFRNTATEWEFIGQNGCKNEAEAKKMFHGIVIHLRPAITAEIAAREIKLIADISGSKALGKDTTVEIPRMKVKRRSEFVGYRPRKITDRNRLKVYARNNLFGTRKRSYNVWYDTTISVTKVPRFVVDKSALTSIRTYFNNNGIDSTIFKVMERNKQWKDVHFICDVTGSMAPYSTQLLVWHKLNFNARIAKYYTFFNDGDSRPDGKIGKSDGVYSVTASKTSQVDSTAFMAMQKGWGGACPENNIEALLRATKQFPDSKEVVMIADNMAPVRDMELLYLLNKPVHIIICGTIGRGGINADLLEIALKTKGSIHTMEEDLVNLYELNEGKKITINGSAYMIKGGKFVKA